VTPSAPVVCADLDRTLIYSPSALLLDVPDALAPRLLCVEVYRGVPLSFMTEAAGEVLKALSAVAVLVPTTTRTPEQMARVQLPVAPARYAIASNGGHLLVDGVADGDWNAHVRREVSVCAPVDEVHEHVRAVGPAVGDGGFVRSLRTASGLFVYAVVERADVPQGWLDELTSWCLPRGWVTSLQGRKVYCVPAPLTKSAAAREVVRRTGADRWLAAGDSLLDGELLLAADRAVRPAHGELADTGFVASHLHVTGARGVLAGEELTRWLLARAQEPSAVAASLP
jgi:hypothetical protein